MWMIDAYCDLFDIFESYYLDGKAYFSLIDSIQKNSLNVFVIIQF